MKLFEIKIVANNFLGSSSKFATIFSLSELDSAASFTTFFESEKKATSAPEINADRINNKNKETILISSQISRLCNNKKDKNVGSGSKFFII